MYQDLRAIGLNVAATAVGWTGLLAKSKADIKQDLDIVLVLLLIISTIIGIAAGIRALFWSRGGGRNEKP